MLRNEIQNIYFKQSVGWYTEHWREESKIGDKVNILGSSDSPHALMWQINVGHDERKRRKIQVAEVKKICKEIYEIKLNEQG